MKKHALLIGNGQFDVDSGFKPLEYPRYDLMGLESVLESCYDTVTPALDEKRSKVVYELHALMERSKRDDLLLIYYSGHGLKVERSQQLYLAMRHSQSNDLQGTALAFHHIQEILRDNYRRRAVVILDCCYSGAATVGNYRGDAVESAFDENLQLSKGLCLLTASSGSQVAQELHHYKRGIFTHYLIEGIKKGKAANDQGVVTAHALYNYAHKQMKANHYLQSPKFKTDDDYEGELALASVERYTRFEPEFPLPEKPKSTSDISDKTEQTPPFQTKKSYIEGHTEYVNGIPITRMVEIPAGSFDMGAQPYDSDAVDSEKPLHQVILKRFQLGVTPVTFEQYDYYCKQTGIGKPNDEGWGRGSRPVINVSWNDVQAYIAWLNQQTGQHYRLPTEAEWEYAARAGSTTKYHWGNVIDSAYANNNNSETIKVGSLKPNIWGLYDMSGNVRQWVEDRWHDNYQDAPSEGSAWESGDAGYRVLRGGSWGSFPWSLRSSDRFYNRPDSRSYSSGFRLCQGARL